MKKIAVALVLASSLVSTAALAVNPTLRNTDATGYKYLVKCGASTFHSSLGGNTTSTINIVRGCTVEVLGVGSAALAPDMKCEISKGRMTCR